MDNEKTYDFKWLVDDIDQSMIFILRSGKELLGTYQVSDILSNGFENLSVKFANIDDLTKFVNYAFVRFTNYKRDDCIIDVPIRKLHYLYAHANLTDEDDIWGVSLQDIDAFGVLNGNALGNGYALYTYKINDTTPELEEIMQIASSFFSLSPDAKLRALGRVNEINMERDKKKPKGRS